MKPRLNGIVEDALALGVSRGHLSKVIKGQRKSPELKAKYHQLQKEKRASRTLIARKFNGGGQ